MIQILFKSGADITIDAELAPFRNAIQDLGTKSNASQTAFFFSWEDLIINPYEVALIRTLPDQQKDQS